ncbi:MAG: SH3 domain-containing protein [Candidatus Daviesbacteria bacterium]|nr:SH3 domain-containing protein [Candidatus Daviesbacteria bacterium]
MAAERKQFEPELAPDWRRILEWPRIASLRNRFTDFGVVIPFRPKGQAEKTGETVPTQEDLILGLEQKAINITRKFQESHPGLNLNPENLELVLQANNLDRESVKAGLALQITDWLVKKDPGVRLTRTGRARHKDTAIEKAAARKAEKIVKAYSRKKSIEGKFLPDVYGEFENSFGASLEGFADYNAVSGKTARQIKSFTSKLGSLAIWTSYIQNQQRIDQDYQALIRQQQQLIDHQIVAFRFNRYNPKKISLEIDKVDEQIIEIEKEIPPEILGSKKVIGKLDQNLVRFVSERNKTLSRAVLLTRTPEEIAFSIETHKKNRRNWVTRAALAGLVIGVAFIDDNPKNNVVNIVDYQARQSKNGEAVGFSPDVPYEELHSGSTESAAASESPEITQSAVVIPVFGIGATIEEPVQNIQEDQAEIDEIKRDNRAVQKTIAVTVEQTSSGVVIPSMNIGAVETVKEIVSAPLVGTWVEVGNTGGDGVFIRGTPRKEDKVKAWSDGTKFRIIGTDVGAEGRQWKNVQDPSGNKGWVPGEYVALSIRPERLIIGNADGDGVNFRRFPVDGEVVRVWPEGTKLKTIGEVKVVNGQVWENVEDGEGNKGWMSGKYLFAMDLVPKAAALKKATPSLATSAAPVVKSPEAPVVAVPATTKKVEAAAVPPIAPEQKGKSVTSTIKGGKGRFHILLDDIEALRIVRDSRPWACYDDEFITAMSDAYGDIDPNSPEGDQAADEIIRGSATAAAENNCLRVGESWAGSEGLFQFHPRYWLDRLTSLIGQSWNVITSVPKYAAQGYRITIHDQGNTAYDVCGKYIDGKQIVAPVLDCYRKIRASTDIKLPLPPKK